MKLNLRIKLNLAVICVILFFGCLSVIFVFLQIRFQLINQVKQGLQVSSQIRASGIAAIFQRGSNVVENIAKDPAIVEYMRIKNINPIITKPILFDSVGGQLEISDEATLRRLVRYNIGNQYLAIYLMNVDGTAWVSTDNTFVGQNYSFRDYFKKAMSGEPWLNVAIGVTSKQAGYYFSYPIKSVTSDNIIGVAVVKMMPNIVHQFVVDNIISADEKIMFTNNEGVIIFSNDKSRIYRSLGTLSQEQVDLIKEKNFFSGLEINPLDYDTIQAKLSTIEGCQIFEIKDKKDNQEEIVSATKIPNFHFYLVTERGLEQFSAPSVSIASFLSLFIFLLVGVIILIIIYFINRFLGPLQILKAGSYQLSQENFDCRLNIKTGDEFEELSIAFNQMADKLEKSYKNLSEQINKLKKNNQLMVGRELKMIELKREIKKLQEEIGRLKNK